MATVLKHPLLVSSLCLLMAAKAAGDLTESQVVERGLSNPHVQTQLTAPLLAAEGRVEATGNWPNPQLEYGREAVDGMAGPVEETSLWLRQEINIAGVHRLNKRSAQLALTAQQHRAELATRDWQRQLRERFYRTLAAQHVESLLQRYHNRLTTLAQIVEQRVDRGDASRYDALRIQQALAGLNSRFHNAVAQHQAQQARLFNVLEQTPQPLAGELPPPPAIADTAFAVEQHPHILALVAEQRSANSRAKAAHREAWPTLTIGVGRKEVNEPLFNTDGELVAVGIEIPLFQRGNGEAQVAESEARHRRADAALLQRELLADYQAAQQTYRAQRDSALTIRRLFSSEQGSLSDIAEASYQAGEMSIMELLDAYRSDLATREQYYDTALQARLSYIELQFLRGE